MNTPELDPYYDLKWCKVTSTCLPTYKGHAMLPRPTVTKLLDLYGAGTVILTSVFSSSGSISGYQPVQWLPWTIQDCGKEYARISAVVGRQVWLMHNITYHSPQPMVFMYIVRKQGTQFKLTSVFPVTCFVAVSQLELRPQCQLIDCDRDCSWDRNKPSTLGMFTQWQ